MSIHPLRRILLTACTLVLLSSCAISKTAITDSEGSTDSTTLTTDGGTEGTAPAIADESNTDLDAIVALVNETAGEQSVNDTIIDTVVGKLQADGKIDPANWEVDTTPGSGAAFKVASGINEEKPYCITFVGVDRGSALDDVTTTTSPTPIRAIYIVGKC